MRWLFIALVLSGCTIELQDKRITPEAIQDALDKVSEKLNSHGEAIKVLATKLNEVKNKK